MKKAAIYDPYWDTLGGGERYTISAAKVLADAGYKVEIEWHEDITQKIEKRFNIKLHNISFVSEIKRGNGYDVCFWVSDGSIPLLYARKNFLHCQVPFVFRDQVNLMNKMKFFRISNIICNSKFTKKHIEASFGIESNVIYPPVDVKQFKPKRKENIILYVGRFSRLTQSKRQDILIESFKKLFDQKNKDWSLVLAGGVEVGVGEFVKELKQMAEGYPVKFIESPNFTELKDLYGKAKIFWSAGGYGVDPEKSPQQTEHFGMTVVESMAAGCVPFAVNNGGHSEIVIHGKNGYLWDTPQELVKLTQNTIDDKREMLEVSLTARESALQFSYETFEKEFLALL
jgi:glycosyltransferase involved in cell wall biosynthesis